MHHAVWLSRVIGKRLDMDELKQVAWELGVADLQEESRSGLAVALVRWLMQHNRLDELDVWLKTNRKDVFDVDVNA